MLTAGVGSAGMPGLFGLLLAMEAGVPVPLPGDVVMLLLGERVSAGALLERRGGTALATGSSVFLQAHLLLGLALGPVARDLLGGMRLPALLGLVALLVVAVAWLLRRREGARRMLAEGCCPACLAAGTLGSARLRPETVR